MCHFQNENSPFVMSNFFLVQTIIITSIYLLALFTLQNLKKFLHQIQSYEDAPFLGPLWSIFASNNFFLGKIINITLIYICPFHCEKFLKKSSSRSRVMRMCNFWDQNGSFSQIRIFFSENLLISPCFFHSCLSACQESKSDINLLVKY